MNEKIVEFFVGAIITVIGTAAIALFKDDLGYVILICIIIAVSIIALYYRSKSEKLKAEIEDKKTRWKELHYRYAVWTFGRKPRDLETVRIGERSDTVYISLDASFPVAIRAVVSGRGPDKIIEWPASRTVRYKQIDVPSNCVVQYSLIPRGRFINRADVTVWLLNGTSPPRPIASR